MRPTGQVGGVPPPSGARASPPQRSCAWLKQHRSGINALCDRRYRPIFLIGQSATSTQSVDTSQVWLIPSGTVHEKLFLVDGANTPGKEAQCWRR